MAGAERAPADTLYNGIVLPAPWPPARGGWSSAPLQPPYLSAPPAVIPIDVGRQLFVDDFLIEESGLYRTFHRAEYHPGNPVIAPTEEWERRDPYAATTGIKPSQSAMVFSDGVFFDPADQRFKMWYMAGYRQHTALAVSRDGIEWSRPSLDVVPGTNIVSTQPRDSNTVWLDRETTDPRARFKMAGYDLPQGVLRFHASPDGIHWREIGRSGPCGDRSTFFRNPFRQVWAFSLRTDQPGTINRYRSYVESRDFPPARWDAGTPVPWTGADRADLARADLRTAPQLYNLDAAAYESVLVGLFSMYRGEKPDREKPNDLCVAFSRDGFHWSREWREPFLSVSERAGDWNWSNVQSAGGCCLVVGDRLYFYVSGRRGLPGTSLPGECSTGLATLRRDGFASVTDQWPSGAARLVRPRPATLTTRPLRFSGRHLFINAQADGDIRVEVLDEGGRVIPAFAADRSLPVTGDGTRVPVRWAGGASLADVAGQPVRFRFTLTRARLYAFWVSDAPSGRSRGYVAGGGPGLSGSSDDK